MMSCHATTIFSLLFLLFIIQPISAASETNLSHTYTSDDNLPSYPFSRLFTTQEERRLIDQARRFKRSETVADRASEGMTKSMDTGMSALIEGGKVPAQQKPENIRFSGFIIRADGRHTAWVNGKSELSKIRPEAKAKLKQLSTGDASVPVISGKKRLDMKPGQVWLTDVDKIEEGYNIAPSIKPKQVDMSVEESKKKRRLKNRERQ